MPDSRTQPIRFNPMFGEGLPTKYARESWGAAGVDTFAQPPSQDQDACLQMVNVLSPMTRVINRRYGYRVFSPKLDQGIGTNSSIGAPGGDAIGTAALQGVGFDGATSYVASTSHISLSENPTLSVEFWFETSAEVAGDIIAFTSDQNVTSGETEYLVISMTSAGILELSLWDGSAFHSATTALAYNDSALHHCVVTLTGGTYHIYIDGTSVATNTISTGGGSNNGYWRLGTGNYDAANPQYFHGFLSHVSIWQRALTSTDVTNHYQALANANGGTQPNYESIVSTDGPAYFWYLTEAAVTSTPAPTLAPVAQIQEASSHNATSTVVTLANATVLNDTILVIVGNCYANEPSVSDNQGNSYTKILGVSEVYKRSFWVYSAPVTNPGSTIVTVTVSSQASYVVVVELRGIVTSSPVDGADQTNGSSTSVQSPSITTTTTPDRVYSVIFSKYSPTLQSGDSFGLVQHYGDTQFGTNLQGYISLAYTSAPTATSYQCNWKTAAAGEWFVGTFGLKLTGTNGGGGSTTADGTTAFDYGDSNNGTYTQGSSQVTASAFSHFTAAPLTLTVNTGTWPINPGDTGLLFIISDPTSTANTVSSITDTNGNTWTSLTSGKNFNTGDSKTGFAQVWKTSATVVVPASSSGYQITVTLANAFSEVILLFVNVPALQIADLQAATTGTSSSPSAGSVNTLQYDFAIACVAASKSISSTGAPFTIVSGATTAGTNIFASLAVGYPGAGAVTDSWVLSSSGNWADFLITYKQGVGYSLGMVVVL